MAVLPINVPSIQPRRRENYLPAINSLVGTLAYSQDKKQTNALIEQAAGGDKNALIKLYGVNPRAAQGIYGMQQQEQQTQQRSFLADAVGALSLVAESDDPAAAWSQYAPIIKRNHPEQAASIPDQYDPAFVNRQFLELAGMEGNWGKVGQSLATKFGILPADAVDAKLPAADVQLWNLRQSITEPEKLKQFDAMYGPQSKGGVKLADLGDRIGALDAQGNVVAYLPKGVNPSTAIQEQGRMDRYQGVSGDTQARIQADMQKFGQVSADTQARIDADQAQFEGVSGNARLQAETTMRGQDITAQNAEATQGLSERRLGLDTASKGFREGEQGFEFDPDLAREQARAGASPPDPSGMRKEFTQLSKDFITIRDSYARLQAAGQSPSAAGDLALIFNYMKILDPGSVVRESEFATAQNAGGVPDRIRAMFNKIKRGERLSADQRADFLSRAADIYGAQQQLYRNQSSQFRQLAERANVDPNDVVMDFDVPTGVNSGGQQTQDGGQQNAPQAPQGGAKTITMDYIQNLMRDEGISLEEAKQFALDSGFIIR